MDRRYEVSRVATWIEDVPFHSNVGRTRNDAYLSGQINADKDNQSLRTIIRSMQEAIDDKNEEIEQISKNYEYRLETLRREFEKEKKELKEIQKNSTIKEALVQALKLVDPDIKISYEKVEVVSGLKDIDRNKVHAL